MLKKLLAALFLTGFVFSTPAFAQAPAANAPAEETDKAAAPAKPSKPAHKKHKKHHAKAADAKTDGAEAEGDAK
jgi:hypothetical protein